jgi:hypothetical protein
MQESKEQRADSIVDSCLMFGINPPRLFTKNDVTKIYKRMPLVADAVWNNFKNSQFDLTDEDIKLAASKRK